MNYHRLDANALSKLIYTYLGDWIGRQERAVAAGEAGAQGRLDAATALRTKLIAIAAGEPPYDIYVRWKALAAQPIGMLLGGTMIAALTYSGSFLLIAGLMLAIFAALVANRALHALDAKPEPDPEAAPRPAGS